MSNSGLPNSSELLAKSLTQASGASGFFGWLIELILKIVLTRASKKGLVIADKVHVAIIVKREAEAFDKAIDNAYEIIDQGNILTQEEKDEIDRPFMEAFIKLATFKLRK